MFNYVPIVRRKMYAKMRVESNGFSKAGWLAKRACNAASVAVNTMDNLFKKYSVRPSTLGMIKMQLRCCGEYSSL